MRALAWLSTRNETWVTVLDRALVLALIVFFILLSTASFSRHQYFVYQADGFVHGSVFYRILPPTLLDSSPGLGGHYYWPLGPFPAVVLMPLVAMFGLIPLQGLVQFAVTAASLWLCFRLARRFGYGDRDSLWLAFAFAFGSVYLGIAFSGGMAWQFATALSTLLVLATLDEYFHRKRYWLMGVYLGCAFATRFTAGLAFLFPFLDTLLDTSTELRARLKRLLALMLPIVLVGLALLWLNYARTGNPWDNGYRSALIRPQFQVEARERYGLFSLQNIPTNLFYYFLIPPKPVIDPATLHLVPPYGTLNAGIGFFFLSPIFLFMFRAPLRPRQPALVWLTSGVILITLLSYYAINHYQLGAYYWGDLLPLMFLMLLWAFSRSRREPHGQTSGPLDTEIGVRGRLLAALPAFVNVYLLAMFYVWHVF